METAPAIAPERIEDAPLASMIASFASLSAPLAPLAPPAPLTPLAPPLPAVATTPITARDDIADFERECAQFPQQYTPEWFARVDSIGGSEMHDLHHRPLALMAKKISALISPPAQLAPTAPPAIAVPLPQREIASQPIRAPSSTDGITMLAADPPRRARANRRAKPVATRDGIEILTADTPVREDETIISTALFPDDAAPETPAAIDIKTLSTSPPVSMGWGTLFEPLLCNYIARRLGARIHCRAVSYFKDPWRFSPDGLLRDENGALALLEMKNPFMRVWGGWDAAQNDQFRAPHEQPARAGDVPPHYVAQLQMGLHMMPFLDYAFYVEAMFRRANSRGFPCALGFQKMRGVRDAPKLASGIIGFYHPSGAGTLSGAIDFSATDNDIALCRVLAGQRAGADSFIPRYFAPADDTAPGAPADYELTARPIARKRELPLCHAGLPLFGYMPWNLLGIHSARVDRDPAFMTASAHAAASDIVATVRKWIREPSSDAQKLDAIRDLCDRARAEPPRDADARSQLAEIEKIIAGACASANACASAPQ
ncbi:MAG: YqaJ viral recombinase family protein [Candidatus Omnitrophica bacterium]|nr:YqaJ viral recombinase family protein [Candidatus Omnitrophota bacterium]